MTFIYTAFMVGLNGLKSFIQSHNKKSDFNIMLCTSPSSSLRSNNKTNKK